VRLLETETASFKFPKVLVYVKPLGVVGGKKIINNCNATDCNGSLFVAIEPTKKQWQRVERTS
jgi:hypothetical protein